MSAPDRRTADRRVSPAVSTFAIEEFARLRAVRTREIAMIREGARDPARCHLDSTGQAAHWILGILGNGDSELDAAISELLQAVRAKATQP